MVTTKKYKINYNDFIKDRIFGEILGYRIVALKDFSDVKKGDNGGYILKEENLSHEGDCWIYNNAIATDDSSVSQNAKVYDNAVVQEHGRVSGYAEIHGESEVNENALVTDYACLQDLSCASGYCIIYGNAILKGASVVSDFASVHGKAIIENNASISGHTEIVDAIISENVWIDSDLYIDGNIRINYDLNGSGDIINHEDRLLVIENRLDARPVYMSEFNIYGGGRFSVNLAIYINGCEGLGYEGCSNDIKGTIWVDEDGQIRFNCTTIKEFIIDAINYKNNDITPEYAKNYIRAFNSLTDFFSSKCDYIDKSWRDYINDFIKIYNGK